jgi:hypothetical protein
MCLNRFNILIYIKNKILKIKIIILIYFILKKITITTVPKSRGHS